MILLSDFIGSRLTYTRSVNVERGVMAEEHVSGYILTQRTLEALDRITTAFETDGAPHAWTITGPYGSGKSAFALFLSGLFSPGDSTVHIETSEVLRNRSGMLADRVDDVRRQHLGGGAGGFIVAMATAEREPAARTIARALLNGVNNYRRGPGRPPRIVTELRRLAEAAEPNPTEVVAAFEQLTLIAPVLLLLDEFGKNLEFAADDPASGDLYVLQQIAESLVGSEAAPGALVTLQHLSFADYAFGLPAERLREWNKIQGRFEDISFLEADDQTAQLIAEALERQESFDCDAAIERWALDQTQRARAAGIEGGVSADSELSARCYPLHPVAVDTLAHLTSRYGQHERSLFTYLTSAEPYSLNWFLERTRWDPLGVPSYGLDHLFDYFVTNVADVPSSSTHAARWLEIRSRVIEARSISEPARGTLKTIGLLNLVGATNGLRASPDVLRYLDPSSEENVAELVAAGVITFRGFADEYRIWEGSDFDLSAAVAQQRDRTRDSSISEQVESVLSLSPRVAQRHSIEMSTLRYFEQRYVERLPEEPETENPNADGVIYYVIGAASSSDGPESTTKSGKPIVAVYTPDSLRIDEAAREAAAIAELLESDTSLARDRVARQEARIRAAIAQRTLGRRLQSAFSPERTDVKWWVNGALQPIRDERDVSRLLSDLCDEAFKQSPIIRNEMINRSKLTSQGARARRELLLAMIERSGQPQLGLKGNGPEVAIYRAVVAEDGMIDRKTDALRLPSRGSSFYKATQHILQRIRSAGHPLSLGTIVDELALPPFGVRHGAIPILLADVLIVREDEIAIYQDGSFEPTLAADVFERLIKSPERFTARYVGADGDFSEVIEALRQKLEISGAVVASRWRNATLLSILRPILSGLRHLPDFAIRTRLVSDISQRVRHALLEVREPDQLLFAALPEALGVDIADEAGAGEYASRLIDALGELRDAYQVHVRQWVARELADALWPTSLAQSFDPIQDLERFREEVRGRSQLLLDQVLDQNLKSFLLFASNRDMPDDEWVDAIAMNVSRKPPQAWRDQDRDVFRVRLSELAGTFDRVNALYFDSRAAEAVDGFTAMRVTLTLPSAQERDRVVWVDDRERGALEAVALQALEQARLLAGPDGSESLLAILAEKVLPQGSVDLQGSPTIAVEDDKMGIA